MTDPIDSCLGTIARDCAVCACKMRLLVLFLLMLPINTCTRVDEAIVPRNAVASLFGVVIVFTTFLAVSVCTVFVLALWCLPPRLEKTQRGKGV